MRMAAVGYYPSFPVKYSNMYNDYSMVTAGLAHPFLPQKKEKADKCNFVVSYIGRNEPKFEMNNPHYMREVSRSYWLISWIFSILISLTLAMPEERIFSTSMS